MFPSLDPKKLQGMMKQLGMSQEEIHAEEVIIKTKDKDIIIKEPHVIKLKVQGQETFQLSGRIEEREKEETSEEDIKTVMEKAGVNKEKAKKALKNAKGDLAEAIISLQ